MLRDSTPSRRPKRVLIDKPGFFDLIDEELWWSEPGNQADAAIHRICTLFRKMQVGTVYLEHLKPGALVAEEVDAISQRAGSKVGASLVRLSAFYGKVRRPIDPRRYLGYAAVLRLHFRGGAKRSYVLEAVVRLPATTDAGTLEPHYLMNNYLHTARQYTGSVDGEEYPLLGTMFCQQNNLTSVCAHACLRMAISNTLGPSDPPLTTEWMNSHVLKVDHAKKPFGQAPGESTTHGGMTEEQMWSVALACGFSPKFWNFFDNPNVEYQDVVYPLVESGLPTLLEFTTGSRGTCHVVPVLGHTLNTDCWYPQAEPAYSQDFRPVFEPHISSSRWVDHFVISDDNFGPYLCLPTLSLRKTTVPRWDGQFRALNVTGLFPQPVGYTSVPVEWKAAVVYWGFVLQASVDPLLSNPWLTRMAPEADKMLELGYRRPWPVFRILLAKKADYSQHVRQTVYGSQSLPTELTAVEAALPDLFWLCEATLPDLYTGNKTKLAEILIGAGTPGDKGDDPPLLLARFPGFWAIPKAGNIDILTDPQLLKHTPLFELPCTFRPHIEW